MSFCRPLESDARCGPHPRTPSLRHWSPVTPVYATTCSVFSIISRVRKAVQCNCSRCPDCAAAAAPDVRAKAVIRTVHRSASVMTD